MINFSDGSKAEIILDSFLHTVLDDMTLNVDGIDHAIPTVEKAELSYQFKDCLKKNLNPQEFEKKLEKVLIEINNPLNNKEKTHFTLLYYIYYLNNNNPNKLDGLIELSLEKLEKLFESDEDIVLKFYKDIKMRALN